MMHKQRMLAAIRGQPTDRIPYAPRMDLWTIAHRACGTMPVRFQGMNTAQIADELGVACHAVRADYTMPRGPADMVLRGLGLDNHPDYAFRAELRDLRMEFQDDGETYETTIHAPSGILTMRLQMTRQMASDGIFVPFVQKYPIESPADYEVVAEVFEHIQIVPTPKAYANFHRRIGDRGLAVAGGSLCASPMHLMLHELMSMENFFVTYMEDKGALEALSARLQPTFDAMLDALLVCDAEVFLWGVNYDRDTTWGPFFVEHIQPALSHVSRRAHAVSKLVLTHTDGENSGLLEHYPACGFDVGESVCPSPMTSLTLAQIREGFGPHATVWGGIPCVVLLDSSTSEQDYARYMDRLFAELGDGRRLIFGVSDNVPPDVNLSRLRRIEDWIEAFGPVPRA